MLCNYRKTMLLLLVFGCFATNLSWGAGFGSYFDGGEQAFRGGNYVEATELYTRALAQTPSDLKARFRLGQCLFLQESYGEAQEQFQIILQNSPGNITARVYYAEALAAMGNNKQALTHLAWVLKVQPEHERARYVYGQVQALEVAQLAKEPEEEFVPEEFPPANVKPLPVVKVEKQQEGKAKVIQEVIREAKQEVKQEVKPVVKQEARPSELVVERAPKNIERDSGTKAAPRTSPAFTPEGHIHIPARPASILPVEYQAKDDEDFFKNYPASFLNKCVEPEAAMAKASISKESALELAFPKNIKKQIAQKKEVMEIEQLLERYPSSMALNLEGVKYYIELGDLAKAAKSLKKAERIAAERMDSRGALETRIYRSLMHIYELDFSGFGQHLMLLKSSMPGETYQAYLDIYNEGKDSKDAVEQARIAAGVAMGATHYAVAAQLLQRVFVKYPEDPIIGRLLSDAQVNSLDYAGAEITLSQLARAYPNSAEAYLNLARFYLTVNYKPEQVRDYAGYAQRLDPEDARCGIVLGLLDYAEGDFEGGVREIRKLMASLEDPTLKAICERIIADGEANVGTNFVSLLALPETKNALEETNRAFGEEYLKRGSFFMAAKGFERMGDMAELGRTYLGLASTLVAAEEPNTGHEVAAQGRELLAEVLAVEPTHGRGNLYLSLYYYEHGKLEEALETVNRGLAGNLDDYTKRRLVSVQNIITS
jgi:tetratricopeptide (TPR) repeat protein